MSVNDQFLKFYENIRLTSLQREDAITKYTGVCKKLHDFYYPITEYNGSTKLLIGSYGKQTHIRPARDIDVIFIMPPKKFNQYDDNQSNRQSQLLQDIKKILEEKYPDTPIKAFGKVVVLEFADTKHDVELLPAWENENGTFKIPNSENSGSWEQWDPRSGIKKIKDSDTNTGKTKTLIRMIKKWSETCTIKLKSYQIENKILNFFSFNNCSEKEYAEIVKNFFNYFHNTEIDKNIKSYLDTALGRAKKACDFERDEKLDEAIAEWRKIFGDDFPATIEKSIATAEDIKQSLADYTHCEALKWPFSGGYRVGIDAYVYNGAKTTKLGGINSDGRCLSAGLQLKFIANTNVSNNFQYYWQVVNTGQAAEIAGGLRGNFFTDNQVRWESTQYKGKHWIECFIIQNDACIARSGKFFINIK